MANYKNYKNEDIDLDVLIESLNENDLKLDLIRKNIIDPDQQKAVFNAMNDIVDGMKQGVVLVNSNKGYGLQDFSGKRSNVSEGLDTYGHAAAFIGKKIREAKIIQQAAQQAAQQEAKQEVQQEAQQTNTEEPNINLNHTSQEDINTDKQQQQEQQQQAEIPKIDEWALSKYGNTDNKITPVGDLSQIKTNLIVYKDRVVLDNYIAQKSPEQLGQAILKMIESQRKSVTIKYNNKDHTFNMKYVIGYILDKLSNNNQFDSVSLDNGNILNFIPDSYFKNKTGMARMLVYNLKDKKIYSVSAYNNPKFKNKVISEYNQQYAGISPLTDIFK